jgi:predicted SAM-dependent methyltransferase
LVTPPFRVDIGAGTNPHAPGWSTVDRYTPATFKAEMWELPFTAGSVDELWSSHALEHVPTAQVLPTLREWFRVLRPGAAATIQVPNLDYAVRFWLEHPGEPWALAILFGNQAHEGEFHHTGWTPDTFRSDLQAAGFAVEELTVVWLYDQETIRAQVRRPLTREGAGDHNA